MYRGERYFLWIRHRDITTTSTIPEEAVAYGRYIAKQDGVLCGMPVVRAVFDLLDEDIELTQPSLFLATASRRNTLITLELVAGREYHYTYCLSWPHW